MGQTTKKQKFISPKQLLQQELQRRCKNNSNYSLRAFARSLGISHTFLSMLLNGKRRFTKKIIDRISQSMHLDSFEQKQLLSNAEEGDNICLPLDDFLEISQWYYYGILSLLRLDGFQSNCRWVGQRLGISELQVKLAIERLKRLEYIEEDEQGNWQRLIPAIKFDNQVLSQASRQYHAQLLSKAKDSLENDPFEQRAIEGFTLTMNSSQIPYARKRLREISKELSEELEKKAPPNQVYNLGLQLYPITNLKTKKGEKK